MKNIETAETLLVKAQNWNEMSATAQADLQKKARNYLLNDLYVQEENNNQDTLLEAVIGEIELLATGEGASVDCFVIENRRFSEKETNPITL